MKLRELLARLTGLPLPKSRIADFENWRDDVPSITYSDPRGDISRLGEKNPDLDQMLADANAVVAIRIREPAEIAKLEKASCLFASIVIEGPFGDAPIKLMKIRVHNLHIKEIRNLHLSGCEIGTLRLTDLEMRCQFKDTLVGLLDLGGNNIKVMTLDWDGGYLGDFRSPPNAVHGDVLLHGLQLP